MKYLLCFQILFIFIFQSILFTQTEYEVVRYFNSLTDCSDTNAYMEDFNCVYFKIEYPNFREPNYNDLNELIKSFIYNNYFDKPYNNFDTYSQEFFEEYKKDQSIYKSPDWWYTIGIDTVIDNNEIISIAFGSYKYMGGAHGFAKLVTMNYEKKTGRILYLDDIFKLDYETKINKALNKIINKGNNPLDFFDYNNYAYNSINSRFLLGKKSLIFMFDYYDEVTRNGADYVLNLPYQLIKDIINSEYIYLIK